MLVQWPANASPTLDRHYLASLDETQTLLAKGEEFSVVFRPHMASEHRGVVLMIPSIDDPYGNQRGFIFLRALLSERGYSSYLLVNRPATHDDEQQSEAAQQDASEEQQQEQTQQSQEPPPQPADETEQPQPSYVPGYQQAISSELLDKEQQRLSAQLVSLLERAQEQGKAVSVFAAGRSAGLLSEYFVDNLQVDINAFIAVGAYLPVPARHHHISANLSVMPPAVLDVYTPFDHSWATQQRPQRRLWAEKNRKFDYRQRTLFAELSEQQQIHRLATEIDGFLRRLF
nr:DUF3530 family protein [Pseudoalteromonas sp. CnMc7-15]